MHNTPPAVDASLFERSSNPVLDAEPKAEDTPNEQSEAKATLTTEGRTGSAYVPTGANLEQAMEVKLPLTMNIINAQYAEFEKSKRAEGLLWRDIPSVTEWVLDRLQTAEQKLSQLSTKSDVERELLEALKDVYAGMMCVCRLNPLVGAEVPCKTCKMGALIAKAESQPEAERGK